ncbi:HAMP domain-containing sensor histidine kinase [Ruegeria sp. R14_0]|uniref:sensor histidine kinase n=1 Tax=Ruegeria sp. R14_0 TaxID=2821100 RepID=UPI001AD97808|nr:HAMP domain-containing sensor histidine kinase [Ruegeria sp. R14_0]MBO9445317.1 HAMP domain-containing protein [Ruegeria sp. R14_0]
MDNLRLSFNNSRTRLVLASMVLSTLLTAIVLGLVYFTANRSIEGETRSVVSAELTGLADEYERRGLFGLLQAIERRLPSASERDALYLLTDRFGVKLAGNLKQWPSDVTAGSGWVDLELRRADNDQLVPISAASIRLPGGERLLVGRDALARQQFDRALLRAVGLALAIALALSFLTGWMFTRLVFSRLSDIASTAENIVSGDLSRRMQLRGTGDEFDQVAGTLNTMLDRIEELISNLRTTSNSIAHDLRSPLSRLRQRVEALSDPTKSDLDREVDVARATAEIDHVLRVLGQLTEISRAEAGVGREQFEPVDLQQLVGDVVELYEPVAADQGVSLEVHGSAQAVQGHRPLLSQALSNLLENAMRYAPDGTAITITLSEDSPFASLSVRDRGPGVPEEELPRLQVPFVTLDPARTERNAGLGLALVAAISHMHQGAFEARNCDPGLEATIKLARKL